MFNDRVFSDDSVQNRDRSIDASVCRKGRTCCIVQHNCAAFSSVMQLFTAPSDEKTIVVAPANGTELHRYVVLP